MKILSKYLIREMLGPTLLGLSFYTFILITRETMMLAELIIREGAGPGTIGTLLLFTIPHVVVLTVPMAVLFGILIAVGRLSSDSEIIAMRSSGLSLPFVYRPVLYFSIGIFLINLILINVLVPYSNSRLQEIQTDLATRAVKSQIQPRVFYDEFDDLVLYVDDIDPSTSRWKGIFIADSTQPGRSNVIVASSGNLTVEEGTSRTWIDLVNARNHIGRPGNEEAYDLVTHGVQRLSPRIETVEAETSRSYKSMSLGELWRALSRVDNPLDRRSVRVEIHKKLSIPFACIAFGLVALPLGLTNRRGGRSSGFSLSIAIILLYYVLLTWGSDLAEEGRIPAGLGIWLPNIALLILGGMLLNRANRDTGRRGGSGRIARLFERLRKGKSKASSERTAVVEQAYQPLLQRLDVTFPNLLDRYVLTLLVRIILLVLFSTLILFIVINYTEIADDIRENSIAMADVISFYQFYSLQILDILLPLSILLGTLITFGILSRNSELVAIKSSGVSLYRLSVPVLLVAALISVVSYFLLDFVLPYSNRRYHDLENLIKGRESAAAVDLNQRQWVWGEGPWLFNFLTFDERANTLSEVQVFEFDQEDFSVTRRVSAREARFDGVGWVFVDGWMRSFGADGGVSFTPIRSPIRLHYPERPLYFSTEIRTPQEMTFGELRRHIRDLQRSGYAADALQVELYRKTAWPFLPLVMALIALPFAFRMGKRGALYGIGIAIFLGFAYWLVFVLFTKFGEVGNLPAILAAWSANVLFAIAAITMFLRVET